MGRAGSDADWSPDISCGGRGITQGSNDTAEVMGSFQETASRKTTENTVKQLLQLTAMLSN